MKPVRKTPELVIYITTGTETSPGIVYQVNAEAGEVLGKIHLPYTATGIDMYRTHGLVLCVPRDGGKILQIKESGEVSTVLEKDPTLPHPTDVACPGDSDVIVAADNVANVVAATSIGGQKAKVSQRLGGSDTGRNMSVAVTNDKHVVFSGGGQPGVFNYAGDPSASAAENKPVLPTTGGVAADHKSLRWAAAQEPNLIYVYEGPELLKKLRLPPGKSSYKGGLLSFSPAGSLIVAVRDNDKEVGQVWFLSYDVDKEEVKSLFPWKAEPIQDFVAGPRMFWDCKKPNGYKSTY